MFQAVPKRLPARPSESGGVIKLSYSIFFSCFSYEERAWAFQVGCRAAAQRWDGSVPKGIADRQGVQKQDKTRFNLVFKAVGTKPYGKPSQPKHTAMPKMAVVGLKETVFDFSNPEDAE